MAAALAFVLATAALASGLAFAARHHRHATSVRAAEHALVSSTAEVRLAIGQVSRRRPGRKLAVSHVRRARLAFRRGRFCAGVRALSTIRLGRWVRRAVDRTLRRAARLGIARGCLLTARTGKVAAHFASGGKYPFSSRPLADDAEPGEGVNVPPLPTGRFRPGWRPGSPTAAAAAAPARRRGTVFAASDSADGLLSYALASRNWPIIEPSEATSGNVVVMTVNTLVTYSTDGGRTFASYIDPATIFPDNPDGGPCCDQVVQYDPKSDRFFWLLQYNCAKHCNDASGREDRLRLAVASPEDVVRYGATRWRYFDITPGALKISKEWFDHPDVAVGANSLYITSDLYSANDSKGAVWLRLPITQLVNKASSDYSWITSKDDQEELPVQGTGTQGWMAERPDLSTAKLDSWDEGSDNIVQSFVTYPTPPSENCSAPGPDGHDPYKFDHCGGAGERLSGAAIDSNGTIWLAWNGGRRIRGHTIDDLAQPHVDLLTVTSSLNATETTIWDSTDYYLDAALTATQRGRIAITYQSGSSSRPLGWELGFLNHGRSITRVATGDADADRIGDYYTVRPDYPHPNLITASGSVLTSSSAARPYYAVYGPSDQLPKYSLLSSPTPPATPPTTPPAFRKLVWTNDIHPPPPPAHSNPPGPEGAAVLRSGNVLVTDTPNDALASFTPAGVPTSPFNPEFGGSSTFSLPRQAVQVASDEVDVSDSFNQRVARVRMSDHASLGTLDLPYPPYYWSIPRGMAVSDDRSLVAVADVGDGSAGGGRVNVFSSVPSWPTFKRQIAGLHQDEGVAFDHNGELWVANSADADIVEYAPLSGGPVATWTGAAALAAAGQPPLSEPTGVAIDPAGDVWVADYGSGRVIAFTADGSKVLQVITGGGGSPLSTPVTLAFDGAGSLYVAETAHDRVARFVPSG